MEQGLQPISALGDLESSFWRGEGCKIRVTQRMGTDLHSGAARKSTELFPGEGPTFQAAPSAVPMEAIHPHRAGHDEDRYGHGPILDAGKGRIQDVGVSVVKGEGQEATAVAELGTLRSRSS